MIKSKATEAAFALCPTSARASEPHTGAMRTFSPKLFNEIANLPKVRPWLGGEGALDLSAVVADPRNFVFQRGDEGGFICIPVYGSTYEVHTLFHPGSGEIAVAFMHRCMEWMFCRTDCVELVCRVPEGHKGAEWLASQGGFRPAGIQQNWDAGRGATLKRLWIEDWARVADASAAAGAEFHQQLETAKLEAGSALPIHSDDDDHDAMVGAALLMACNGQVLKGVNLYNHWAVVAGYAQIQLLSVAPPLVDIVDAIVGLENGKMEILLCR